MGWKDDPVVGGWQADPVVSSPDDALPTTLPFGKWDTGIPIPKSLSAGLVGAGRMIDRQIAGAQQLFSSDPAALKARMDDETKRFEPLAKEYPWATGIGEAAPLLAGGPLTMAAFGANEYGTPTERGVRAGLGFVGGKAGELVGKGIGRVAQPVRTAVGDGTQALLDKFGLSGLPGQITGSAPLQWVESALSKLPGGGSIRAVQEGQQKGLNKAAMEAVGATGDAVTPEAVQLAKSALGPSFDHITSPVTVAIDRRVASNLTGIESNHLKNLSPDQKSIVRQYIDDILQYGENGMPGDVYQKARSRIAARAASTTDSELKTALTGIYKTLDRAFDASAGPEAAAAIAKARRQWAAAKTIEPMANETGNISAARLANGAKGMPGDMGDLAKLGSKLKQLPDSGTAQRLFYQTLLSGGAGGVGGLVSGDPTDAGKWAATAFAGPWLASQLLTRGPTQKYLTKGLMDITPEMEKLLKRLGGTGGGLLGLGVAP